MRPRSRFWVSVGISFTLVLVLAGCDYAQLRGPGGFRLGGDGPEFMLCDSGTVREFSVEFYIEGQDPLEAWDARGSLEVSKGWIASRAVLAESFEAFDETQSPPLGEGDYVSLLVRIDSEASVVVFPVNEEALAGSWVRSDGRAVANPCEDAASQSSHAE